MSLSSEISNRIEMIYGFLDEYNKIKESNPEFCEKVSFEAFLIYSTADYYGNEGYNERQQIISDLEYLANKNGTNKRVL